MISELVAHKVLRDLIGLGSLSNEVRLTSIGPMAFVHTDCLAIKRQPRAMVKRSQIFGVAPEPGSPRCNEEWSLRTVTGHSILCRIEPEQLQTNEVSVERASETCDPIDGSPGLVPQLMLLQFEDGPK